MRSFAACCLIILGLIALPVTLVAQRSGSSYIFPHSDKNTYYNPVGLVGRSIHVWEVPAVNQVTGSKKVVIKIHIFSEDMQLLSTRELPLDSLYIRLIEDLDFQINGDQYLATIYYVVEEEGRRKMQIRRFRMDEKGDGWNARPDASGSRIPVFASVGRNRGEDAEDPNKIGKLHVRRIFPKDSSFITQEYSAGSYRFTWPRVAQSDHHLIWVVSLAHNATKKAPYGVTSQGLFMARLDSNLTDLTRPRLFSFIAKGDKRKLDYLPQHLLAADSSLFILSKESDPYLTPIYNAPLAGYNYTYQPNGYGYYNNTLTSRQPLYLRKAPRSLRITLVNPSLSVLQDTIISADLHGSTLDVQNIFVRRSENGIDVLIDQSYSSTREGIRRYSIDTTGKVSDRDLMVDAHYHFILDQATALSPRSALVPFTFRNRIGFLVQSY